MKFELVLEDLEKLRGQRLQSIGRGSGVTIEEVRRNRTRGAFTGDYIVLETSLGHQNTWPVEKLRRLWEALCQKPAIHVDSFLHGSGSSRNQPETLFANLPYVEWLTIDGKKHIVYAGQATHAPGTLRAMDSIAAEEVREKFAARAARKPLAVIITADLSLVTEALQQVSGTAPEALAPGVYKFEQEQGFVLVAGVSTLGVEPGTYAVVEVAAAPSGSLEIQLGDITLHAVKKASALLMLLER